MDNKVAAEHLEEIADLIELTEDEPFKARAYRNAARTLSGLEQSAEQLMDDGKLGELPGFGTAMVAKLGELFKGGRIQYLEELREQVPPGLIEMRKVPGLGPKKIRTIRGELGITSLSMLRAAAEDGTLSKLSGFGARSVAKIASGIEQVLSFAGQWTFPKAERVSSEIARILRERYPDATTEISGQVRRRMEVIDSLHWVTAASGPDESLLAVLKSLPMCQSCEAEAAQVSMRFAGGVEGIVHFVDARNFGEQLLRTTGPEAYVEFVLTRRPVAGGTEEEVVEAAGLPLIPPECRDAEQLWQDGVPESLLTVEALRGVLHCHTTYSDGRATLREMVEGCIARGFRYIGICDHSQSAGYAGGLNEARVREQHAEIDKLNSEFAGSFRIFKGIESDIRVDGSLDYPDDVLARFDFVVASIHSVLDMDEATATERTCRALANPYTTFLGHPTGRLLLARNGFPLEWERVIKTAAKHNVSLELNANPRRLDVDWRILPGCFEGGLVTAINPDAHSVAGIDDMSYGVGVARKAGTTKAQTLNCLDTKDLDAYFKARRPA